MSFESRFQVQYWLIQHGPLNWLARVVGWARKKNLPTSIGFGKFRENDPTLEEAEHYKQAKDKAEYGIFELLTPGQHEVIATAAPSQQASAVDMRLQGNVADNDEFAKRIAKQHNVPLNAVRIFAVIADPKNAHLFSREAAIKVFSRRKTSFEDSILERAQPRPEHSDKAVRELQNIENRRFPELRDGDISSAEEPVPAQSPVIQCETRLENTVTDVLVILMAVALVAGIVTLFYEVLKRP